MIVVSRGASTGPLGAVGAPQCPDIAPHSTQTLSRARGSHGPAVEALQCSLTLIGCDTRGVDGVFGADTDAAVRCLQQRGGGKVDGIVGQQAWTLLYNQLNPGSSLPVPPPGPASGVPPRTSAPPRSPTTIPWWRRTFYRVPVWGWGIALVGGLAVLGAKGKKVSKSEASRILRAG